MFALEDASLSWLEGTPPVLTGVNLEVRSGQVVAVAGEVGSGKTTVLNAVVRGTVLVQAAKIHHSPDSTLGYAAQSPFLISASLS